MEEAENCGRILLINDGKIVATGSPGELKSKYKTGSLEELFVLLMDKKKGG